MAVKFLSRELLAKQKPTIAFPRNLELRQQVKEMAANGGRVYEFIGTDTFGEEWYTRQRYEVDAGRLEVPILYTPIYSVINDANLPRNVSINKLGPGGVVLEEIQEGGEVKFATIASSQESVQIKHYGVGLEYSDDLVAFNELWTVPVVERQVGRAYNALLNHLHLGPILDYAYGAGNQTAANSAGATTVEDFFLTIEDAITEAKADQTNPRPGPYVLLVNSGKSFVIERALTRVPQQGNTIQSSALDMIQGVIAYDGWTGTRGKKTVTYPGVASGKGYLIHVGDQMMDFVSYMKQGLEEYGRDEDVSRFLLQIVWDTRFGVYANPLRSVQEITWP